MGKIKVKVKAKGNKLALSKIKRMSAKIKLKG